MARVVVLLVNLESLWDVAAAVSMAVSMAVMADFSRVAEAEMADDATAVAAAAAAVVAAAVV